ncbi:malto-oligosyltrehalose synthase [Thioclava kandeliae]|uniref:Malto-oligosyltrehalose synthase n=1 Tax=Thioclava kandeliae TaxID=3070818 RepID=A0ABV1SJF0_9RHOB
MSASRLPPSLQHATASYRIQLRNGVTFDEVTHWLPYLVDLGISHLYLSPVFTATSGSTHGYDVTAPDEIDPALGGHAGFVQMARAAQAAGLSVILDIVPNHTALNFENRWLRDVLRFGPQSRYARHFDIDWAAGPFLLTMLGAPLPQILQEGQAVLVDEPDGPVLQIAGLSVPLDPQTVTGQPSGLTAGPLAATDTAALLARQHWQLVHWELERDSIRHRRFFNVTSLIGMRVEDRTVFDDMHGYLFSLVDQGLVQGLRVDHIDGLADPETYLARLHERLPQCPVWVEKILSGEEELDTDWPVAGTTGYEAARAIAAALAAPEGVARLQAHWARVTGRHGDFADALAQAKHEVLRQELPAELWQLTGLAARALAHDLRVAAGPEMLREALSALLEAMPRYRTYFTEKAPRPQDLALWRDVTDQAAASLRSDTVLRALSERIGRGPTPEDRALRVRFQQISGALIAKSLEDTAGFRCTPYLAANEVGAEPDAPAMPVAVFERFCKARLADWPAALTLTSSHDTKRSEDARMRLVALGHLPDDFLQLYTEISGLPEAEGVAPATVWYLAQSAIALWEEGAPEKVPDLGDRLARHMEKALREAKEVTFWAHPVEHIEQPVFALARAAMACLAQAGAAVEPALARIVAMGDSLSLCQTALKLVMPGIPDLYRGCEGARFELTDPDNRRPVSLAGLTALQTPSLQLQGNETLARRKMQLVQALLALRKKHPALFLGGACEIRETGRGLEVMRGGQAQGLRLTLDPYGRDPVNYSVMDETTEAIAPL